MDSAYSTGNRIVDESATLNITGNVIPHIWYKTIVKESGKPYLTAIVILADIVYWYKPAEVRDERTGQIVAFKKRFSYTAIRNAPTTQELYNMFENTEANRTDKDEDGVAIEPSREIKSNFSEHEAEVSGGGNMQKAEGAHTEIGREEELVEFVENQMERSIGVDELAEESKTNRYADYVQELKEGSLPVGENEALKAEGVVSLPEREKQSKLTEVPEEKEVGIGYDSSQDLEPEDKSVPEPLGTTEEQ